MPRQRIHGANSLLVQPHPVARYKQSIQMIRWRRSPTNATWEAKVVLPDGSWTKPFSLGSDDLTTAALTAVEEFSKRTQLHAAGLPLPSRQQKPPPVRPAETFGDAAQPVIERLTRLRDETKAAQGSQKAHKHVQHLRRIRNILMPAFGDVPVRDLTRSRLNDWMRKYRTPDGTPPKQNTVGNLNHSFQLVMQAAVERAWIRSDDVPAISKKGFQKGDENPWFTRGELERLRDHMTDDWVSAAHTPLSREIRYLLRAYIAVASCTGIRPGLELERVQTTQILHEQDKKMSFIRIPILRDQGKYAAGRNVICFENDVFDVRRVLEQLMRWHHERSGKALTPYLFARSDGRVPSFDAPFRAVMVETGLLIDPETGKKRVPYSLRHYFATQALLRGEHDHIVARWMGTSPQMIDIHYNKIKLRMQAGRLAGTGDKMARMRAALSRQEALDRLEKGKDAAAFDPADDDPQTLAEEWSRDLEYEGNSREPK